MKVWQLYAIFGVISCVCAALFAPRTVIVPVTFWSVAVGWCYMQHKDDRLDDPWDNDGD